MAPVCGHKIEDTAGDEGKRARIGAGHPLAMHGDLAIARGDEGGRGADHPRRGLHGGSREARTSPGESDPGEGTNKHGDDIDAAEDAMELEVALANPRGKIDGAGEKSEDSGECMWDEEMAVGSDLQAVGVVHRIVGDEEQLRSNEDKERVETKRNPENSLESGTGGAGRSQSGNWHYSLLIWLDVTRCAMRATRPRGLMSLSLTRHVRVTDLTSTAPRTTVPAATSRPSPPLAEPQPRPAGSPNPPSGRPAGTTPAHHAAQASANAPTQTSDYSTPTAPNH